MTAGSRVDELAGHGAAVLGSCGGRALPARIRPVWDGARCAGIAQTASCAPGDNLAIHALVSRAHAGSVLVVAIEGPREHGFWGEVLTVAAQARGAVGLVIDGCVRDVAALAGRRFPVFAAGVALPDASKTGPGSVGPTITMGGAEIHDGDVVVADIDGVVAVPEREVDQVLQRAEERVVREAAMFAELERGATTVELLGLEADLCSLRTS